MSVVCVGGVLTQTSKHLLGEVGSPWDERGKIKEIGGGGGGDGEVCL